MTRRTHRHAPFGNPRRWRGPAADEIYESPNPHRLYRNPRDGMIFGVCAGLADYMDVAAWKLRLALIVFAFFFPPGSVVIYLLAAVFLRSRPEVHVWPADAEEDRFWRAVSGRPSETFHALRHRYRELDARLATMEHVVTSEEFRLAREIDSLK